jgi:hypothetical protein
VRLTAARAVSFIVALGRRVGGFAVELERGMGIKIVGEAVGRVVAVINWKGV